MAFSLFGKKTSAPARGTDPTEDYRALIQHVGTIARAKLYDDPDCPRSIDRVVRAEDTVDARRTELQDVEAQMDEIDAEVQALAAEVEDERQKCSRLVEKWKKPVEAQLRRVKDAQGKLKTRTGNLKYAQKALEKEELRLQDAVESNDQNKEATVRANNKRLRLDYMKAAREASELEEEIERLKYPKGVSGEEAIHARMRVLEREDELARKQEEVRESLEALDEAAAGKEQEIAGAEEFLAEAIYLMGEDVYAARLPDPQLDPLYDQLDALVPLLPQE